MLANFLAQKPHLYHHQEKKAMKAKALWNGGRDSDEVEEVEFDIEKWREKLKNLI